MILCGNDCEPCCDFCTNGKRVTAGPEGCKLHKDKEHQDIAATCGYCDDFCCFRSLGPVDSEIAKK